MWFILALLSSLFNGLGAFSFKVNSMKKGTPEGLLWGFFLSGMLSFIIFATFHTPIHYNSSVIFAGITIGVAITIGNFLFSKSVKTGPAGLAAMIAHSNVVLIILMSLTIYKEKISLEEIVGIILLIAGIIFLPLDPNQELKIKNKIWYFFIGITFVMFFVRNGGLKITEEMQLNNSGVLLIAYIFGFIWFSVHLLVTKRKMEWKTHKTGIFVGMLAGVLSFVAMQTYASALATGPASIISPIVSSNGIIVALLSYGIYKEYLSKFQIISFVFLLFGILLMKI
jgi:uncharacterized membrane protein